MKTLGQIAFEAYNADRGGVNYRGEKTPDWEELPEGIRHAWEVAAEAAVSEYANNADLPRVD